MSNPNKVWLLTINGEVTQDNTIPADLLANHLGNLQRAIRIIGNYVIHGDTPRNGRLKSEIKHGFRLICHLPTAGSYAVPITFDTRDSDFLKYLGKALEIFMHIVKALESGANNKIDYLLPDGTAQKYVIDSIRELSPREKDQWNVEFSDTTRTESVRFNRKVRANSQIEPTLPYDRLHTFYRSYKIDHDFINEPYAKQLTYKTNSRDQIIGELQTIDFHNRLFSIKCIEVDSNLYAEYPISLERILLQNIRKQIIVSGSIRTDQEDIPIQFDKVSDIYKVDLSPVILDKFSYEDYQLELINKRALTPTLDEETGQLFCLEDPELGIDVFAESREELLIELNRYMDFLWRNYAQGDASKMTPNAQILRSNLLNHIQATFNEQR